MEYKKLIEFCKENNLDYEEERVSEYHEGYIDMDYLYVNFKCKEHLIDVLNPDQVLCGNIGKWWW